MDSRNWFHPALLAALILSAASCSPSESEPETTTTQAPAFETRILTPQLEDIPAECLSVVSAYLIAIEPRVDGEAWLDAADSFSGSSIAAELESITSEFIPAVDESCVDVEPGDLRFSVVSPFAAQVAPGALSYIQFIEEYIDLVGVESGCPFWLLWRWSAT